MNSVALEEEPVRRIVKPAQFRRPWIESLRLKGMRLLALYLLVFPVVGSLIVFAYYPKIDVLIMSTFRWDPPMVQEYIGLKNFRDAFADPLFWQSFRLVVILLLANLIKLWPGIFAAIALHRLASDRLRYAFQTCFVVPMLIPAIVGLLVWKSFFDPDFGLLNKLLNATGLMSVLNWLDHTLPSVATGLRPFLTVVIDPVFGNVFGLVWVGAVLWALVLEGDREPGRWRGYLARLVAASIIPIAIVFGLFSSPSLAFMVAGIQIAALFWMASRLGRRWILWPFLMIGGLPVFWNDGLLRLPVLIAVCLGVNEVIRKWKDRYEAATVLTWMGVGILSSAGLLASLSQIWIQTIGQFETGNPAWLGSKDLVIPALLFWGFPWVGTVSVLLYLSGLQNIPEDVYEAAELDGAGPWRRLFSIELPLILTQLRIKIIMMTIAVFTSYETFLLMLGADGGPGNKGMVPGLYIFKSAFSEGKFGYGCALGVVLFVIVMTLTIVYQRYVKVEK